MSDPQIQLAILAEEGKTILRRAAAEAEATSKISSNQYTAFCSNHRTLFLYTLLLLAILCEALGTSLLKTSHSFRRPLPTCSLVLCYIVAYGILGYVVQLMPLSIAYATWCGLGIIFTSLYGLLVYQQHPPLGGWLGLGLVVIGCITVNLCWSDGHEQPN